MTRRPHLVPSFAAATLLVIALGQHPYGFYTFLRWTVTVAAAVVAWVCFVGRPFLLGWPFVGIGILFNPIRPIYLTRDQWRPIDVMAAIAFAAAALIASRERLVD